VLAWRISNTLEAGFCVDALNEAIHKFGPPEIMNTDQGSQFTSFAWTNQLRRSGVRISMDGKGRFLDNIFVERLWRSLKYECVYSRKVLAWRLSNSMDAAFCVDALKEALAKHGKPEIFNTDQGSQFTSGAWIDVLTDAKIKISMDGKGAWRDNRMIERLWRSLKYECVYLNAFETGSEMRTGIGKWLIYYNSERPHSTHGILTPDEAYVSKTEPMRLAA